MAVDKAPPTAADVVATKPRPTETVSQFIARVLDQLSLSAWLPSAALVLAVNFIVQLGLVLDAKGVGPGGAIGGTLARLSATGIGGAVLLVVAIAVLTMLTQAFSFEAIRILEGYWGTARAVEWIAQRRAGRHRRRQRKLADRRDALTRKAWDAAKKRIAGIEEERRRSGRRPVLTTAMISRLESRVLQEFPAGRLTAKQEARVEDYDWQQFAPAEVLRRRVNIRARLRDFPAKSDRVLPTRLGNVIRAHEDKVSRAHEDLESFVQRNFDDLPPSLKESHDQARNRLELYCSMTFVVLLSGLLGIARFAARHWPYAAGTAGTMVAGTWVMYRAAVTSARYYGQLLVTIAAAVSSGPSASPDGAGIAQVPPTTSPPP